MMSAKLFLLFPLSYGFAFGQPSDLGEPPVKAPFVKKEDSLCVNDWWNRPANPIIDLKVPREEVVCFGIYIRQGIKEYGDGPWAFVVPAIVNNYYGRWWWPESEKPGNNPVAGSPLPWTGDYLDGFNNKITMVAYANPDPKRSKFTDKPADEKDANAKQEGWADGYGFIRFKKSTGEVTFECWPRYADVSKPDAKQFPGWPVTVKP